MSKRIYSDEILNGFQQGSDAISGGRLNHPDDIKKYFSSKTFKDFLADKTSPLVYCTLTLDGKPFLDKSGFSLHLGQNTNDHDSFTITVPDDALDSFQGYVMENSKNILGKNLTINLHRFGEIKNVFTGIIANIRNKKENGYGKLFITGSAPSILLENGKDCQSFEDKTLEHIIKEATSEYPEIAKVLVENPNTKYSLPYTVQYKESDYGFIKRLASRYGEYFYYNGQQMVFGNKVQPIITLEENIDLIDVELEMNIRPQEFNYHTYDVQGGSKTEKSGSSSQVQYKENPFQAIAINASKNVYKKTPDMLFNHTGISDITDKELKEAARREKENKENQISEKNKALKPLKDQSKALTPFTKYYIKKMTLSSCLEHTNIFIKERSKYWTEQVTATTKKINDKTEYSSYSIEKKVVSKSEFKEHLQSQLNAYTKYKKELEDKLSANKAVIEKLKIVSNNGIFEFTPDEQYYVTYEDKLKIFEDYYQYLLQQWQQMISNYLYFIKNKTKNIMDYTPSEYDAKAGKSIEQCIRFLNHQILIMRKDNENNL